MHKKFSEQKQLLQTFIVTAFKNRFFYCVLSSFSSWLKILGLSKFQHQSCIVPKFSPPKDNVKCSPESLLHHGQSLLHMELTCLPFLTANLNRHQLGIQYIVILFYINEKNSHAIPLDCETSLASFGNNFV